MTNCSNSATSYMWDDKQRFPRFMVQKYYVFGFGWGSNKRTITVKIGDASYGNDS